MGAGAREERAVGALGPPDGRRARQDPLLRRLLRQPPRGALLQRPARLRPRPLQVEPHHAAAGRAGAAAALGLPAVRRGERHAAVRRLLQEEGDDAAVRLAQEQGPGGGALRDRRRVPRPLALRPRGDGVVAAEEERRAALVALRLRDGAAPAAAHRLWRRARRGHARRRGPRLALLQRPPHVLARRVQVVRAGARRAQAAQAGQEGQGRRQCQRREWRRRGGGRGRRGRGVGWAAARHRRPPQEPQPAGWRGRRRATDGQGRGACRRRRGGSGGVGGGRGRWRKGRRRRAGRRAGCSGERGGGGAAADAAAADERAGGAAEQLAVRVRRSVRAGGGVGDHAQRPVGARLCQDGRLELPLRGRGARARRRQGGHQRRRQRRR